MLNEYEKYAMALAIIRSWDYSVRETIRKPKLGQKYKPIDGSTFIDSQTICITLPMPLMQLTKAQASEAASILLHEYGHAYKYTHGERAAWKNAEGFLKRFPMLKPNLFDHVKRSDLAEYKASRYNLNQRDFIY